MASSPELPALLPRIPTRADIERLEDAIVASGAPLIAFPTRHYFWTENGVRLYAREITIPAGTVLTGKVHREPHVNAIPRGRIRVWTEEGMKTLAGPHTFLSRPGTKRAGLALEETVWTTIHVNPTDREDPEEMERLLVEPARPEITAALLKGTPCLL